MIQRLGPRLCHYLLALVAGALLPLTMAPWNIWGLALVSIGLLAYVLKNFQDRPITPALFYGLGLFSTGASWVFVSIYTYGNTGLYLALILTSIFVLALAVLFAIPWQLLRYCRTNRAAFIAGFAGLWVLGEWLRGWLFTGFPWLYVGYGQLDSPLAGWMPLIGSLGVGLLVALSTAPLVFAKSSSWRRFGSIYLASMLVVWGGGSLLKLVSWTQSSSTLSVTLVQPNISVQAKWNPLTREAIIDRLMMLSEDHWDSDLMIWPEAALPLVGSDQAVLIGRLNRVAYESATTLVTGRLKYEPTTATFYNSLVALGQGNGDYHKHQLVPFGEYVPFENQLRGLIDFFDLPNSVISVGESSDPLQIGENTFAAAAICYEIAYAGLVGRGARDAQMIITVSNDAWFGESIGPDQHLQIARVRAIENGKPVARATNNGVTALIDADGKLLKVAPRFEAQSLSGTLRLRSGSTPFSRYGHWPLVLMGALLLLFGIGPKLPKYT